MSSPSGTLSPLPGGLQSSGKKRRPNFRPTSRRSKAKPSRPPTPPPSVAAEDYEDEAQKQKEVADEVAVAAVRLIEQTVGGGTTAATTTTVETSPTAAATTQDDSPKPTRAATSNRGRKRKQTGVEVGSSRPTSSVAKGGATLDDTAAGIFDDAEKDEQAAVPDDTPRLNAYCSKFRSKRTKKTKAATPTQQENTAAGEESSGSQPAGPVVQVVNGEIVLQESSMVVMGNSSKADEEFPVVEEEAQLAAVGASYNSFVSRRAPQHWTVEETQLFYEALRQVGVDFGTMEVYFGKKRTRKQLKQKYKIERTKHPGLIEKALNPASRKEIDLSVFQINEDSSTSSASKKTSVGVSKQPSGGGADKSAATTAASKESESTAAPGQEKAARAGQEPLGPPVGQDDEEPPERAVHDPLLDEEDGDQAAVADIALVPTVASKKKNKTKSKTKPWFWSRKMRK